MFEIIANISSIITIALFIIYIIGKIWAIYIGKKFINESFEVTYLENKNFQGKNVYLLNTNELSVNELITIKSTQGLNWINIYKIYYDEKKKKFKLENKKPLISHKEFLNINEEIYIKTIIPCGIPIYRIVYRRFDYIIESFDIGYNGQYGGLFKNNFKKKVTILGYLYYFFK